MEQENGDAPSCAGKNGSAPASKHFLINPIGAACTGTIQHCNFRWDDGRCLLRQRRCRWLNNNHSLLTGIHRGISDIKREVLAWREDHRELRAAKRRLEEMQREGLFGFVQKIDRETLDIFFVILASGDIAKASRALGVKDSTLRSQVAGWRRRGKPYRALAEFVRWRKSIRGQAGIDFSKRLASGAEREADFAGLIRDIIEELENLHPSDWEEKCQSLADALRHAIS